MVEETSRLWFKIRFDRAGDWGNERTAPASERPANREAPAVQRCWVGKLRTGAGLLAWDEGTAGIAAPIQAIRFCVP
jgi:hypothetical protein